MKFTRVFESIIRGVSQQAPHDRLEGQHADQVNMLSDPVRGLVRRNGMLFEDASSVSTLLADSTNVLEARIDSYSYRTYRVVYREQDYDLLYRSRPIYGTPSPLHLDGLYAFDRLSRQFLDIVSGVADDLLPELLSGGVSAVTSVGQFVAFASGQTPIAVQFFDAHGATDNQSTASIVVKQGTNGRTYTVTATSTVTGLANSVSYTVPSLEFPGEIDLEDLTELIEGDPDYWISYSTGLAQRQAEYEQERATYIVEATEAAKTENIATALTALLNAVQAGQWSVSQNRILGNGISKVSVSDGRGTEQIDGAVADVTRVDDLPAFHRRGQIVKVQAKDNEPAYYVVANASPPTDLASYGRVSWQEAAGIRQTISQGIGLMHRIADKLYIASSPAALQTLLDDEGFDVEVPLFIDSESGDRETSITGDLINGAIVSRLVVFQGRFVVCAGNSLVASRIEDYFSLFPRTVLTVPDDSAFALELPGNESVLQAVEYDRNLYLITERLHLLVSGRSTWTPNNKVPNVLFELSATGYAAPAGLGNQLFFAREDTVSGSSVLMQVQAGLFQDQPTAGQVSQTLRDYVNGTPAEIVVINSPNAVFIRTEPVDRSLGSFPPARPSGVYLYQFLDGNNGERITDAWSAWEWASELGTCLGLQTNTTGDGIRTYSFQTFQVGATFTRQLIVMNGSARSEPQGLPYIDGLYLSTRIPPDPLPMLVEQAPARMITAAGDTLSSVADTSSRYAVPTRRSFSLGDAPPETLDPNRWAGVYGNLAAFDLAYPTYRVGGGLVYTGMQYPSYIDLSGYYIRHNNGKAKQEGLHVIMQYKVTLTRTAGFTATWADPDQTNVVADSGGAYSLADYTVDVWVGREVRDANVRLSGKDWYPITINALTVIGQWFGT